MFSYRILKSVETFPNKVDLQNKTHFTFSTPKLAVEVWEARNETLPVIGFGTIARAREQEIGLTNATNVYVDINEPDYGIMGEVILLPRKEVEAYLKENAGRWRT